MKTCKKEGCTNKHYGKGLCNVHYQRQYKNNTTDLVKRQEKQCIIVSCCNKHHSRGLCKKHYERMRLGTLRV